MDIKIFIACITGLAGVVAHLYMQVYKDKKDVVSQLKDCHDKHGERDKSVLELVTKLARMEGQVEAMNRLGQQVVESVRDELRMAVRNPQKLIRRSRRKTPTSSK